LLTESPVLHEGLDASLHIFLGIPGGPREFRDGQPPPKCITYIELVVAIVECPRYVHDALAQCPRVIATSELDGLLNVAIAGKGVVPLGAHLTPQGILDDAIFRPFRRLLVDQSSLAERLKRLPQVSLENSEIIEEVNFRLAVTALQLRHD
jgi:hypothetical protein